jgi:PIN domain nuclease of toxin-antitoxin system
VKVLLDTQAFLWAVDEPSALSARAKREIQAADNQIFVSAATAWEIAIKFQLGDLGLPQEPQLFVPEQLASNAFAPLPVLIPHALKVAELPAIHRDPFDRLIVAQALIEDMVLVTSDAQIRRYPVRTIW